ncbi:FAD-dependent oxidoreductase [Citrobacter youngae]|uniref:FAD-dependent oxidoreductase n=1 Tax=Citrobacter youngae TaxID=133448 RepID=UPI003EE25912
MSHSYDYDAIVIGSGPGGEGAAMGLVKQGARVAVIERYHNVGGGCTHWGTIPSKALRHAVSRIIEFNQNPLYSDHSRLLRSSFADILNHADNVINQQTRMRQGFYERNHCEILQGNARFVDEHTIALECHDGTVETLTADKFVIACGSRPYHPTDVDFSHPRVYDSDSILSLHHEPRHVLIYGAGVIGCEYASIFRGMDVKVDLINTRDRLLAFLDQEMSDSLSYHFWNSGVVIRHNEEYERIEGCDDGVIMHLKSGKKLKADCLLYANGRTGNTDSLALVKESEAFIEVPLFDEPMLLAIYEDHPWANRDCVPMSDLAGEKLLMLEDGHCLRDQAMGFCFEAGADEDTHFRATSLETLRNMVAAGSGITLLPALAVPPERKRDGVVYLPCIKPEPRRTIGLVYRPGSPLRSRYEQLAEAIRGSMDGHFDSALKQAV